METPSPRRRGRPGCRARFRLPVAVAAVLLTSGCGSNFNAESQDPYQPGPGISDRAGDVYVINMLVATTEDGAGTVVGSLVNQRSQADYVVEFTATHGEGGELSTGPLPAVPSDAASSDGSAPSKGVVVPADEATQFPDDAKLQVSGDAVVPGTFVTLTFTFHRGDPVSVEVPVFSQDNSYVEGPVGATSGETSGDPTEGTPGDESPTETSPTDETPTESDATSE